MEQKEILNNAYGQLEIFKNAFAVELNTSDRAKLITDMNNLKQLIDTDKKVGYLFKFRDAFDNNDFMLVYATCYENALNELHKLISPTVMNKTVELRTMEKTI